MSDEIRRGLACLVAQRDEWEARAEVDDWSTWPESTATGLAIWKHFIRLGNQVFERTHE